jgi:hypothetical protein
MRKCEYCGEEIPEDKTYDNNKSNNLVILCHSCHCKLHSLIPEKCSQKGLKQELEVFENRDEVING